MFTAVSFVIAKNRKQPKRPSVDEWINKLLYVIGEKATCRESKQVCGARRVKSAHRS